MEENNNWRMIINSETLMNNLAINIVNNDIIGYFKHINLPNDFAKNSIIFMSYFCYY